MTGPASLALAILSQLSTTPASRVVAQQNQDWVIAYTFANPTPDAITVTPADLAARISSPGLSNTRAIAKDRPASHGVPRRVAHAIDGYGVASDAALRGQPGDADRCLERARLGMRAEAPARVASEPNDPAAGPVTVPPGGALVVRVILSHVHEGGDGLDPLLGRRDVVLRIGGGPSAWVYRDTLHMDREQYVHMPDAAYDAMASVPAEHRDSLIYFSAPDSLILDASEPGGQYHRFTERKVRGGAKLRLRFVYQVTAWCDGEARVRVAQYRESPNAWKVLSDSGFERVLRKPDMKPKGKRGEVPAGKWLTFDETFRLDDEATTACVDLRLAQAEVGLMWVDDVTLQYVGVPRDDPANP